MLLRMGRIMIGGLRGTWNHGGSGSDLLTSHIHQQELPDLGKYSMFFAAGASGALMSLDRAISMIRSS